VEESGNRQTALHLAGIFGHKELIEVLIRGGADPTKVDKANSNIFHLAVGNGKVFFSGL